MSFFSKDTDPNSLLQEMNEEEILALIEEARKLTCNKAKVVEQEASRAKDEAKAARALIKTLKEEHTFLLERLSSAEEALRRVGADRAI